MGKKSSEVPPWKKSGDVQPPWRQKAPEKPKFEHAKLRATNEPGQTPTMYLPPAPADDPLQRRRQMMQQDEDSLFELDPRLKLSFQRNFQFIKRVFSFDTLLKPLPPEFAQSVARNLGFFTRIFTQFFDPKGIQNAQRSIGLGQEEHIRRVR